MERAGHSSSRRCGSEPITNGADQGLRRIAMGMDVLARDVREDRLVPIALRIEHQKPLPAETTPTEAPATDVESEFEWHVEARKRARSVALDAGEIVYRQAARPNEPLDLVESNGARVVLFEGAARLEATCEHGEDERLEERPVAVIERTIDEDRAAVEIPSCAHPVDQRFAGALRAFFRALSA